MNATKDNVENGVATWVEAQRVTSTAQPTGPYATWVGFVDRAPLVTATFTPYPPASVRQLGLRCLGFITHFVVDHKYRNEGLGTEMMEWLPGKRNGRIQDWVNAYRPEGEMNPIHLVTWRAGVRQNNFMPQLAAKFGFVEDTDATVVDDPFGPLMLMTSQIVSKRRV